MSDIQSETDIAYIRTEPAVTLPPPSSQTGVLGWLRANSVAVIVVTSSTVL